MKLEIGFNNDFEIRKEFYPANGDSFTILYLSDFHFNRYKSGAPNKIAAAIEALNPDIILLGGDFADTKKGLLYFNNFLQCIAHRKNIVAVAGNHDEYYGIAAIEKVCTNNNVAWIEKKSFEIQIKNTSIQIDGNKPRLEQSTADFSILCLHKPINISKYQNNYDIAFAGHLHGCQFVFWQKNNALYPGRLFFRWNVLKQQFSKCRYYISKGLGDALPIRFNCRKEMIFVTVGKSLINNT